MHMVQPFLGFFRMKVGGIISNTEYGMGKSSCKSENQDTKGKIFSSNLLNYKPLCCVQKVLLKIKENNSVLEFPQPLSEMVHSMNDFTDWVFLVYLGNSDFQVNIVCPGKTQSSVQSHPPKDLEEYIISSRI